MHNRTMPGAGIQNIPELLSPVLEPTMFALRIVYLKDEFIEHQHFLMAASNGLTRCVQIQFPRIDMYSYEYKHM